MGKVFCAQVHSVLFTRECKYVPTIVGGGGGVNLWQAGTLFREVVILLSDFMAEEQGINTGNVGQ